MRQKDCFRILNERGPHDQKWPTLGFSMEGVRHKSYNDVKPFSEVIKIETEFLTSKCVEKGYPIFFQKHQI